MPAPKAWLLAKESWDGVPRALWSPEVKVPALGKAAYAYLVSEANKHMRAFPSQEKIMAALQVGSDNTVRKALDDLVEHNMLELLEARHRGEDGQWKPATYQVLPPGDWRFPPSADSAEGEDHEPSAETAPGPAAETAEGDGAATDPPSAESAGHQEREAEEMRARAREASPAPRGAPGLQPEPPALPRIDWSGKKLQELWSEMWTLAAQSAGAVRIALPSGLLVDVFTELDARPRTVVVWREGGLDPSRKDFSQVLKNWNEEVETFWEHVFQKNRQRQRDWAEGAARSYPLSHKKWTEQKVQRE